MIKDILENVWCLDIAKIYIDHSSNLNKSIILFLSTYDFKVLMYGELSIIICYI